jgi:hypothetical protein
VGRGARVIVSDMRRFPPPWFVEEIEACFVVRLQENAGLVSNVNCGDIVRLPLVMQTARFGNPPIGAADAFSMWIEYETKSGETKKPCAANASRSQSANDKRGAAPRRAC